MSETREERVERTIQEAEELSTIMPDEHDRRTGWVATKRMDLCLLLTAFAEEIEAEAYARGVEEGRAAESTEAKEG